MSDSAQPAPEEAHFLKTYKDGSVHVTDPEVGRVLLYAGVTAKELGYVAAWQPELLAEAGGIIDDFYDVVKSDPTTAAILEAHTTVERQKPMVSKYISEMTSGTIDDAYVEGRLRIGHVHDRVELPPLYYAAQYRHIQDRLGKILVHSGAPSAEVQLVLAAFDKVVLFDTSLILSSYAEARQQRVEKMLVVLDGQRQELETLSEQMAATAEETLAATTEINLTAQLIADGAGTAGQTATDVAEVASTGTETSESAAARVSEAGRDLVVTRDQVVELSERAKEIDSIVALIQDVAAQTNLLALNAAIEAARAGEHGRGFAVVASEVKTLAESTSESLQGISNLVKATEANIGRVVESLDVTGTSVSESDELSKSAQSAFEDIRDRSNQTAAAFQEISASTTNLATSTREVEEAARTLAELAQSLAEVATRNATADADH